jgi:hypothetical protein
VGDATAGADDAALPGVVSAGVAARSGEAISENSVIALKKGGVPQTLLAGVFFSQAELDRRIKS